MFTRMWTFKTARFVVAWDIEPDTDVDLSWDDTGETAEKLNSGEWQAFASKLSVSLDGVELAAYYLSGSIYADPKEFRDHIGMNARGHGSYFSDMVREACSEARKVLTNAPHMRRAA